MAFGQYNLQSWKLGDGIDSALLQAIRLQDGTTFQNVLETLQRAVESFNLTVDPLIGNITYLVQDRYVRVPQGSLAFSAASELTGPRPQRLTAQGWMLQLIQEDLGIELTWQQMRKMNLQDVIELGIQLAAAGRDRIRYHILNRLFDTSEVAVESGLSPGVATGSGTVTFTPPKYGGTTHASSHSHANSNNSGLDDCVATNVADLSHHGIAAPYMHLVSSADSTTWKAEANFVKRLAGDWIRPDADTDRALGPEFRYQALDSEVIGVCEDGLVWPITHIPTLYVATLGYRGLNNPENPVAIWIPPDLPGVVSLRADSNPISGKIIAYLEMAVGIRRRVNAAVAFKDAGAYTDPVIT